jgi:hypothetical protein
MDKIDPGFVTLRSSHVRYDEVIVRFVEFRERLIRAQCDIDMHPALLQRRNEIVVVLGIVVTPQDSLLRGARLTAHKIIHIDVRFKNASQAQQAYFADR